jgi:hypothetical protein
VLPRTTSRVIRQKPFTFQQSTHEKEQCLFEARRPYHESSKSGRFSWFNPENPDELYFSEEGMRLDPSETVSGLSWGLLD